MIRPSQPPPHGEPSARACPARQSRGPSWRHPQAYGRLRHRCCCRARGTRDGTIRSDDGLGLRSGVGRPRCMTMVERSRTPSAAVGTLPLLGLLFCLNVWPWRPDVHLGGQLALLVLVGDVGAAHVSNAPWCGKGGAKRPTIRVHPKGRRRQRALKRRDGNNTCREPVVGLHYHAQVKCCPVERQCTNRVMYFYTKSTL